MFRVKLIIHITTLVFFFLLNLNTKAQGLRIMPLGNSITYDDNVADKTNPRPVGDRIAYRYHLYQLIKEAGYEFDFVGSENTGINYFEDPEYDDNAGFPGINDGQMAYLINTGYNQRAGQYEAPGPYLLYYPADIILLHIGTNDLASSPGEVEDILDYIRLYDSDVIVLVARIINRNPYSSLTTTFNNNVEAMVSARGDNRIIMVNMENGAGINYTTDMADYLHPNTTGYSKMAAKWFEVMDNLNTPPEISEIPQQNAIQGEAFTGLCLDNFVTDNEDTDNLIQWTCTLQDDTKLSANIDGNRILQVTINDNEWYGSETIKLKATDSGNGSFRKTDSVTVVYNIIKANEPPVITSTPVTEVLEDSNYQYTITATDNDGDPLTCSVLQKPEWLSFSSATHALSGRPTNNEVGTYNVQLRVSDGDEYADQDYELTVVNTNDLPVITSAPVTTAKVNEAYLYEFVATDVDTSDNLIFSYISLPSWLSFNTLTDKAILHGTPSGDNIGANSIILKVSDGHTDVLHGFTIDVSQQTGMDVSLTDIGILIYPNPVRKKVALRLDQPADFNIVFYDLSGALRFNHKARHTDKLDIDLSEFSPGIYLYKIFLGENLIEGKIVKAE